MGQLVYYRAKDIEDSRRSPELSLVCAMLWRAYQDAIGNCEQGRISHTGLKYQESALHWLFNADEEEGNQAQFLARAAGLESYLEKVQQAVLNNEEIAKTLKKKRRWRYGK